MRKKKILFALTSLLISLCIPASSQEVEIKHIVDTVYVPESMLYIENTKDDYIEIIDEYCGDIPLDSLRDKDGVYLVVPEGPDYPGGPSVLFDFIKNTMVYPAQALKDSIQGRVIVQFIVEEDGSITNPVVVKSSGQNRNQAYSNIFNQLDAEALRIISVMPKWNPGKVEGKPCRVRYNLPINFRIEG